MVKLNFDFGFSEPLLLVGEGSYALTAVKEIHATDEFLGLDIDRRKCQTVESYEDCTSRKYLDQLEKACECVPYNLRNFTKNNQVI